MAKSEDVYRETHYTIFLNIQKKDISVYHCKYNIQNMFHLWLSKHTISTVVFEFMKRCLWMLEEVVFNFWLLYFAYSTVHINDGLIGLSDSQIFVILAHANWVNQEVDSIWFVIRPICWATRDLLCKLNRFTVQMDKYLQKASQYSSDLRKSDKLWHIYLLYLSNLLSKSMINLLDSLDSLNLQ